MTQIIGIIILTIIYAILFIILRKKFNIIKLKTIIFLFLGGALLFAILQPIYLSFGKTFTLNLLFFKGDIEINDFLSEIYNFFDGNILGLGTFFGLFIAALLEEIGKFYFFTLINKKTNFIKNISTSIIGITYVAMGFAYFETCAYIIIRDYDLLGTLNLVFFRGIVSTVSHIFFSSIIAYNYGKVLFMNYYMIDGLEISKTIKKIKFLKKICPFLPLGTISKYNHFKYVFIGLFFAITIHTIYNTFMDLDKMYIGIIIVFIGIIITIYITKLKRHNNSYKELNDKIKCLKEINELKKKLKNKEV